MKLKLFLLFLCVSTLTFSQVYVNKTVTGGANDGTSWANAYSELANAMANNNGVDFWVAAGTYKPTTTSADSRNAQFRLLDNDKIYGGFGGSETLLSQRNPAENPTILSGDLNGDDNAVILHTEPTRQDNSYHVVRVYGDAQNLVVDGFTITGGNANDSLLNPCGTYGRDDRRKGAAIMVQPNVGDRIYMTVANCIIEKNTATDTSVYTAFNGCSQTNVISDTDFVNCIVRDNHSDTNGAFTFIGASQHTQRSRGSITNSVLYNNSSTNGAAGLTVINSSGGSSSGTDVEVINATFTKNTGFNGNTMKIQKATTTYLRNSIVWGNNAGVALNISNGTPHIENTIVEGGQGGINSDPLFVDAANDDFQIQLTSPAFNAGDNSYLPAGITEDINGENRIFATIIDLGAYEYACTSCNVLNTTIVGNGSVSPAGGVYAASDIVTLTATADAGWMFSGWSGDYSGNTNPASVTMSASKTITATFVEVPTFVDVDATGANNGSSWANAYTDLKVAIANTTAGKEIWVAEGVYVPSGATRTAAFDIQKVLKIYGGFSGIETAISQRNGGASILSGDRNGDDNATLTDSEPTRQDNSYHVFMVRRHIDSEAGVLDGFTISGGNSNLATANGKMGAAIYANPFSQTHRVKWRFINCTIEKNTSSERGAVFAMYSAPTITNVRSIIDFENCIIRDNYSKERENIYYSGSSTYNIQGSGSIINSLIYNNKTDGANRGAALLLNGSATSVDVINSTFANNTSPNNHVIKLNLTGSSTANIKNNIIYNNGSTQPFYLTGNTPTFSNNIVEGGQLGNTNADPLFTDATANDFTLQSGSPAIDAGDDSFITGFTTDLIGNTRTNGTVDLGCFEYDASLKTITINKVGSGVLNPLVGLHSYTTGANIVLTATPSPGWTFTGWTGTTTEATTNFAVVLNSNMTYTAHFTENPTVYVDTDATGTGDGTSWANAFTSLTDALVIANSNPAITQVWIAEGTYTPHASDVFTKFEVTKDNVILYGGFIGTEILLSDRDLTANHATILSGDLNNDDTGVGFGIGSRNNNSMHIMQVYSNGVVLDGLHFEDANAFGSASSSNAGAVYINGSVNDITFKNCEFNNNVGKLGGTIYAKYTTNATLTIENCIFNNNYSRYGSGVYMLVDGAYTVVGIN